jgi:hypothetical protein
MTPCWVTEYLRTRRRLPRSAALGPHASGRLTRTRAVSHVYALPGFTQMAIVSSRFGPVIFSE